MAPGSSSVAWFGMRAPTITGADGIERAVILPVNNFDKLTSDAVNAEFGAPIFLDLGGRSIRDISKNAADQYLISAGTGDTDDSLKNWALYTWDGNADHAPQMVKELPTDEGRIGAWEGIAELPTNLTAGSRVLMLADSGDTGLGKSYGQYVTIGEPIAGPDAVTGIAATGTPGAIDTSWNAAARATRYYVTVKTAAGAHAPGSPKFVTGTSTTFEGLTAGTEYTVQVRCGERRHARGPRHAGHGHADPGRPRRDHDHAGVPGLEDRRRGAEARRHGLGPERAWHRAVLRDRRSGCRTPSPPTTTRASAATSTPTRSRSSTARP